MSPKKSGRSSNENKIDDEVFRLTRKPLYPDLDSEKENMEFSYSDDSPDKFPGSSSPTMAKKSNSDSRKDILGSPKLRSRKHPQHQMNDSQNSNNSDVDMETDDFVVAPYLHSPELEKSKISPNVKIRHLSPKMDRDKNSDVKRKVIQNEVPSQKAKPFASTSMSSHSMLLILLSIIFFALLFIYLIKYPGTSSANNQFNSTTLVKGLKFEFKDQPPLTFRIIHSALKNVLEMQPTAPAIILLLATNGSKTLSKEFSRSLVDSLSVPEYTVKISGKDYIQVNTNNAKKTIDRAISSALKVNQLGSVLIDDLDLIPGQAAMIFHKYCDHENAPFKKAVFVMNFNYNKAISDNTNTKVWDKAANDHLLSVWTDIGVDQVTPLLARLTVSVAIITA